MATATPNSTSVEGEMRDAIHRHWVLFLLQGLILIVLGLMAIGEPLVATFAVTLFAGWLFVISGIIGFAGAFTAHRVPGFWWTLISALLAILIGIYLISRPLAGVLTLTLAVGLYFGAQGIAQIITAVAHRRALPSWGWVLLAGIVNIVLAMIIWSGYPGTAEWVLGLLFGVNLLFWGISLTMTAISSRTA